MINMKQTTDYSFLGRGEHSLALLHNSEKNLRLNSIRKNIH